MPFSSPSYWVLTFREFYELTSASTKLNTLFSGRFENPDCWFPESEVILMEHDRVEAGEWDNFHKRFNPVGYQNVAVIGLNGFLAGEIPKSNQEGDIKIACFKQVRMNEILKKYKKSAYLCKNGIPAMGIDLWDMTLKELKEYEDRRVHSRTYIFSSLYVELFQKDTSAIMKMYLKQNKGKACKVKGFKRISKKGKRK